MEVALGPDADRLRPMDFDFEKAYMAMLSQSIRFERGIDQAIENLESGNTADALALLQNARNWWVD